jgi:hypothetical protein
MKRKMTKLQIVKELHKPARRKFVQRCTQMRGIDDTYQIDLVEMIPYAKQNRHYKYILTIIDIFSKYAWAFPIKNKTSLCVMNEMKKLFNEGHVPKNIHSDMGKEFYNAKFRQLMNEYNINHYSTFTSKKAAIVERFNRTLKNNMWQKFHLQGSHNWIKILPSLLWKYNNTKHRTIQMKPNEVSKHDESRLLKTVYKNVLYFDDQYFKFRVNDYVRISKFKSVFEKGYMPNWTTEIFQITSVQPTQPVTYLLKDYQNNEIKGAFYAKELQKVAHPNTYLVEKIIRRGPNNRYYVKWLGFDSTHNSWIHKKDLV